MSKNHVFLALLCVSTWCLDAYAEPVPENDTQACQDGMDNDEDGYIDCDDQDCGSLPFCQEKPVPPLAAAQENTPQACQDGTDNDADGFVDCADQDCTLFTFCTQPVETAPAQPEGCTTDMDCKGARVCKNGQCVERIAAQPTRVSHGMPLFIAGTVLSGLGLAALIPSFIIGIIYCDEGDEYLGPTLGPGVLGFALNIVGQGMLLGAKARPIRSLKNLGQSARPGFQIAGAVLYGVSIVTFGVLAAIGPTVGPCPGPFFAGVFGMTLIAFAVNVAGWATYNRRLNQAKQTQAAGERSKISIVPYISPTRGGAAAGIAAVF